MVDSFELILDRCLDRIQKGEAVETILSEYPEYADRLRPLLDMAVDTTQSYSMTPSSETKLAWKQKFNEALVTRREARRTAQPWFRRGLFRYTSIAVAATLAIVFIITTIGIPNVLSPVWPIFSPESPVIVGIPNPDGNFAFLISDDVNAIASFDNVTISISNIGLQNKDTGEWVEFQPQLQSVDLVKLPGDITQEVWRGNIPSGAYSTVFIYVDNVSGVLKGNNGQITEIKLPSNKLHITIPFTVSEDTITSFTYDITVFATGKSNNVKYILKPVIRESGATQTPRIPGDSSDNHNPDDDSTKPNPQETSKPPSTSKPTRKPK